MGFGENDLDFGGIEGYEDLLVWDTPTIVTIDDLIASNGPDRSFKAMGVPPLRKNRKAACGKYKEEIISQLREMAKSEPTLSDGHEDIKSITQLQFSAPQRDPYPGDMYSGFGNRLESTKVHPFEEGSLWLTDNVDLANENLSGKLQGSRFENNCLVPEKDSDIGGNANLANYGHEGQPIHDTKTETLQVIPKFNPRELTSQERDSAILRYKEKKRTRRYDKHIRYESRRIRAENRTRIKGRFAKINFQATGMQ